LILRILKYLALLLSLAWLVLAHSPQLMDSVIDDLVRYANRRGDLYKMSGLPGFGVEKPFCDARFENKPIEAKRRMFMLGDSFLGTLSNSSQRLTNIDHYFYIRWTQQLRIPPLDSTTEDILIIEIIERHALGLDDESSIIVDSTQTFPKIYEDVDNAGGLDWFSFKAESVLQQAMFNDPLSLKVKEVKAGLSHKIFNRVNEFVYLSEDEKNLYYHEEMTGPMGSFTPISDQRIDEYVAQINKLLAYYRGLGFDKVYFVIVPNKVTVLDAAVNDAKGHNHLIERVFNHPKRDSMMIDVYTPLVEKSKKMVIYHPNDTHWNCDGEQVFIDIVNELTR
jgi:hypothetical protein